MGRDNRGNLENNLRVSFAFQTVFRKVSHSDSGRSVTMYIDHSEWEKQTENNKARTIKKAMSKQLHEDEDSTTASLPQV